MSMYEIMEEPLAQKVIEDGASVDCIVLLVDSLKQEKEVVCVGEQPVGANTSAPEFVCGKKSYDINMLGASMYNWVARACPSKPTLVQYNDADNLLETIRPFLKNAEYTLVLFSDTPLLTAAGVNQILDFAASGNFAVCKLSRGYVFKTDYIKGAEAIYATTTYDICAAELKQVDTLPKVVEACNILANRIISYHINAGVNIVSPSQTYIECAVKIAAGATIEPFVSLRGNTSVGKSKICISSSLTDAVVADNCIIKSHSCLVNGVVQSGCIVSNNSVIVGRSVLAENCTVHALCLLNNTTAASGTIIGAGSQIVNTQIATNVTIGQGCKCLGDIGGEIKIGSGAKLCDGATVLSGVYVRAGQTIESGSIIAAKK